MLNRTLKALKPLANAVGGLVTAQNQAELPAYQPAKPVADALSIPVQTETNDTVASRAAQLRGQFLARQDRWEELSAEIQAADLARKTTPGGLPIAELMAFGARSDVVHAVEHALAEDCAPEAAAMIDGISGLELMRRESGEDPYLSLIVALTHVDIGWAWRGTHVQGTVPELNRDKCSAHFDRATELLLPWCGIELDSPSIAAARCALLAGQRDPHLRIADDYEDLIDLHPENPRHMRSLGYHLLPRWFGSLEQLELEARRTASRTIDLWGCGAYTWVNFDAIVIDDKACARIDVDFFIEGLHDIVERAPGQEMINLLASYCAVAMRRWQGHSTEADLPRLQIIDCAEWLVRDHLTEVHPLIWAHAADGFDNNARVTSLARFAARGRDQAMNAIADLFRDDIRRGQRVTFTPDGPQLHPA